MALLEKFASGEVEIKYQAQTGIFKLPIEIRKAIYAYVLQEHILHLRMNLRKKRGVPYAMWYAATPAIILYKFSLG
jgi:hypothetical protein